MAPQRAVRPRASDPRVLDRPHLDGTAELVCRARARHVDGVFQGSGFEDHAAGHQILRLGVGAVGDHALVAPDRGPRVLERGSGVAPALPGQPVGPAIPLLDVGLKLRGRQIVPRDSAPTKDQHELAPQGTFPASRFRHHGSQPYPPPGLSEPRDRDIRAYPRGTPTAPSLSLPKSPGSGVPACSVDTGGGHPMLMPRDKTEHEPLPRSRLLRRPAAHLPSGPPGRLGAARPAAADSTSRTVWASPTASAVMSASAGRLGSAAPGPTTGYLWRVPLRPSQRLTATFRSRGHLQARWTCVISG